jgi:outer membrane lipoprotein-sorting protein
MIIVEKGIFFVAVLLYPYVVFSQSLTQEEIVRQYDEYLKTISTVSYDFSDSAEGGFSGKIKFDGKNQQFWSCINISKTSITETRVREDIALRIFYDNNEYVINSSLKPMAKNVAVTVHLHPLIFGYFSTKQGDFISITNILKSISFNVNQKKLGDRRFSYYLSGNHNNEKWEFWFETKNETCFLTKIKYSRPIEGLTHGNVQSREIILEYFDAKQSTPFFPCKYIEKTTSIEARIYHDGRAEPFISTFNNDYSIKNVSIIPDDFIDTLQLSLKIPNYTPVHMQDAPQIQYVWIDGKIEPLTDELALARIQGQRFIPGIDESRFWFIAIGIILMSLGLVRKLWKHITSYINKK